LDKKTIRQMMKQKRLLLDQKTFFLHSQHIMQCVLQHPIYQKAQMIGIYVSLHGEVDTKQLITETLKKHHVCVPKVAGDIMHFYEIQSLDDLKEGHFHVLEPITNSLIHPQDIDLMIVPMLAYNQSFHRVGYGKGYYDKYFSHGFHGYKLGIAFSWQYIENIEYDEYDQQLDEIINENTML